MQTLDVTATDRPLAEARTLPGVVYRDPAVFEFDTERFFGGGWVFVGHESDLVETGDFATVDIGRDAYVLCRDEVGRMAAHHNSCRHRGTRVVDAEAGHCRQFVCPYHGWTYRLDGRLRASSSLPNGVDRSQFGLASPAMAIWNGLVFVNSSGDAGSLDERLADFPSLARVGLDRHRRVGFRRYRVRANWKLLVENFNECYHCAIAHPALHRLSRGRVQSDCAHRGLWFTGGPMPIVDGAETLSRDGRFAGPPRAGLSEAERRRIDYFHLYPNLLLTIAPDYVMTHAVWPQTADLSDVATAWYATPDQCSDPEFDLSGVIRFWDDTNRQDWQLCERAQRGVSSSGYRPGPYHPDEECVHDFDRWYARAWLATDDVSRRRARPAAGR